MDAQEATKAQRKVYVCICICVRGLLARSWEMGHRKVIFSDCVCRTERQVVSKVKPVEAILDERKYIQRYGGELEHRKECSKN